MSFNSLKSLLLSGTSKDSLLMLVGSTVSILFNFILIVLLSNNLTTAEFGLIVTGLTFIQLLTDSFGLGIGAALLNFLPSAIGPTRLSLIKSSFIARVVTAIIVSLGVYLLAQPISVIFFKSTTIMPYIQVSALAIFLMMIIFWGQTLLQAEKRFFLFALTLGSINVLRFLAIIGLFALGLFSVFSTYLAITLILSLVVIFIFLKIGPYFLKAKNSFLDYKKIFQFGLPAGIGFSVAAIYTKLDQLMVISLVSEEEAGIYGLAFRTAAVFILVSSAFTSAIMPRYSSLVADKFSVYFKKTMIATAGLALIAIAAIPLSPVVFPVLFGKDFIGSILPYQVLTLGMVLFIISSPMQSAILYQFKKNFFSLAISLLSLILMWFLLNLLIPQYKSLGAAFAVTIVYAFQLLISISYLFYLRRVEFLSNTKNA